MSNSYSMIPLALEGTNFIWNIIPACDNCNKRKGIKTAEEFIAQQQKEEPN